MRIMSYTLLCLFFYIGASAQYINEFHYEDSEPLVNDEFVEIYYPNPQPVGFALANIQIHLYNGQNDSRSVYNTQTLFNISASMVCPSGESGCYYTWNTALQDGAPDGIALADASLPSGSQLLDFISYEGDFVAANGPAAGQTSFDVGVFETPTTAPGTSISRGSDGTWQAGVNRSPGGGNPNASLPVELISFDAERDAGSVMLIWKTAIEINNDYFIIEHSLDGRKYEAIGQVKGQRNSLLETTYEYPHQTPGTGDNYYRLRQVDIGGESEYSHVSVISMNEVAQMVRFWPTVIEESINFELANTLRGTGQIELFDLSGKLVHQEIIADRTKQDLLFLGDLEKGQYMIRVTIDNQVEAHRMIKL